jgi:hypothetical protein
MDLMGGKNKYCYRDEDGVGHIHEECKDLFKTSNRPWCRIARRKYEKERCRAGKRKAISYLGGECADCGAMHAIVERPIKIGSSMFLPAECFDIDHTLWKNKKRKFSQLSKKSWALFKKEIDDCEAELVCKNCHAVRTRKLMEDSDFKQKRRIANKKNWVNQHTSAPKALNTPSV